MILKQEINKPYTKFFYPRPRYGVLMGGRGAGRSTVESQYILSKLMAPEYFRCAIMRFILGDIRNSCFRELKDRAEENGVTHLLNINESQMTISYGNNSIHAHGFRKSSGDQSAKLKSLAGYNHVWIEEADEVAESDFMQLDDSLRTIKGDIHIDLTLNPPPRSHWLNKRMFDLMPVVEAPGFYLPVCNDPDVLFIHTDYHCNTKNMDAVIVRRYEGYKELKPHHYWNMIKGYVPEVLMGRIYKEWRIIDEIPHEAKLLGYGLDFGFDPDAAAIVAIYYYNEGYILDEVLYGTELDNQHLATVLLNKKKAPVVADSAEPKSINEMRKAGVDVFGCEKGGDSVRFGIKHVQSLRISYTRRSVNIHKEYENYVWKITKDGDELGIEDPKCENHAMSAARYGLVTFVKPSEPKKKKQVEVPASRYEGTINPRATDDDISEQELAMM